MLELCASLAPLAVFLDFDRTLCSTKSGASPLRGAHALDAELLSATAMHRVYVLTRNSHAEDIRAFLAERGVRVAGVHTTRKGRSKGEFIAQTLAELQRAPSAGAQPESRDGAPRAIFVDDSAAEVCDARIAGDERVFRVLFQRSAL